jgi:hypothetical protein
MCGLCTLPPVETPPPTTPLATTAGIEETTTSSSNEEPEAGTPANESATTPTAEHTLHIEYLAFTITIGVVFIVSQLALLVAPGEEVRYYFD